MAGFILECGVITEMAQVVAGEGVAEGVRLPVFGDAVPAGKAAELAPMVLPARGADAGVCGVGAALQQAGKGRLYADAAGSAGFAVAGKNGNAL